VDLYRPKEKQERWNNHILANVPVLFLGEPPGDVPDFVGALKAMDVHVSP